MSIIYSYPEQGALNANDMLIGTSAEKVGGKQKNITRNFSIQQIADFVNGGTGFIDPVASDFQIAVFNQAGKKITGSIMSQDTFPNGTGITISGNLTTTGNITTPLNLTANGAVSLGGQANLISLNSTTKLGGPIQDAVGSLGNVNQILLSNGSGIVTWQNYEAGLTYEGTWDASNNTTNGLSNSPALVQGVGVSGHFYIVNVEGTTSLGPGLNDWHVGDWAVFLDQGGQPASWQKIDNTSVLTGDGTADVFAKWTDATTLNDSLMSQLGTNVIINGGLKVKDTVEATTTNSNLKLKGNGTGGVEVMSADGVTDGKITLNCSQNSHGVTLQSPSHGSGATYTLVLPTNFGGAGDVLTSAGTNPSQLVWTTPVYTTYDLGSSTDGSNVKLNLDASVGNDSSVTLIGSGVDIAQTNDVVTFTVPPGDTYDINAGVKVSASVPLNLTSGSGTDNSVVNLTEGTGITLTRTSATDITISGSAQGVTGSGTVNRLPKFDTTTSLSDSIVEQGGGTTTIVPLNNGPGFSASISFNPQTSLFGMDDYANRNTVTGPAPQVGDVFNFVLTSDLTWAVGGAVIPAGTYPFTITSVGSGLACDFNSYTIPSGASGTGYTNLVGNGSSTSVSSLSNLSINGELNMLTNKITNVVDPSNQQDAATKQYVDTAVSGALTFKGTFNASTGRILSGNNQNLFLYSGTSGVIAINKGDFYIASVSGDFYGTTAMNVGDEAIALNTVAAAPPGSSVTDWSVVPSAAAGVTGAGTGEAISFFSGTPGVVSTVLTSDPNIVVNPSGYLGIGTSTPQDKLHVKTTVNEVMTLESITSSQKIKFTQSGSTSNDAYVGSDSGDLAMFTNNNGNPNTQSFTFNKDGKLGVGQFSTLPQANVDISDLLSNPSLRLYGANTGAELKIEVSNSFGNFDTTINSAQNDLIFQGNNIAIMSLGVSGSSPSFPTGSLRLNQYGQGTKTGTATYNLTVDGLGNVIEDPISGGASATITSRQTTTTSATTVFLLGATPNGNSVNFVDVFIDGVYQETTTYSVSGVSFDEITFNSPVPSGVTVETKTTADYNIGAAVDTVSIGQSNTTGNVDLRIAPLEVLSGQIISGNANSLYIFTATGAQSTATVNLPSSPTLGDSIKISNLGGLANVLGANGNKIMGAAADLTINVPTAAFEIIWSGSNNGWIIIGNV